MEEYINFYRDVMSYHIEEPQDVYLFKCKIVGNARKKAVADFTDTPLWILDTVGEYVLISSLKRPSANIEDYEELAVYTNLEPKAPEDLSE